MDGGHAHTEMGNGNFGLRHQDQFHTVLVRSKGFLNFYLLRLIECFRAFRKVKIDMLRGRK